MPQLRHASVAGPGGGGGRHSSRFLSPLLTAASGLCLSVAAFLVVSALRDSRNLEDLRSLAEDRLTLVATRLQTSLLRLEALHAFWLASEEVRADEFDLFAGHLIEGDPAIQALEWAPLVLAAQRAEFEAAAASVFPGYTIRERTADGSLVPAGARAEYFPIHYLQPVAGNEQAIGFDLASEPKRREALDLGRDLGGPVASRPLRIVQANGDANGFLCAWPIQRRAAANGDGLLGYLIGVYRMAAIVEPSLGPQTATEFRVCVQARLPAGEVQTLYDSTPPASSVQHQVDRQLDALGLQWSLVCGADQALLDRLRGPWQWVALGAGLLFTMFVTMAIVQRQARAEALLRINAQLVREAQLMESLQQTQRLESLGVLAGGIAHDFNNLLTGILGNSDVALDHLPAGHPAHECVAQVRVAARRAADLTAQLLAYAGRANLEREPLDLSALVRDMGGLLHTAMPPGVELVHQLDASLPAVKADKAQIQQVLLNLVINGAEACRAAGGLVRIQTRRAGPLAATAPVERVQLVVTDTGCGMPPEVQRRMFEPFFTTKFQGRGLGLASVRGIVHAHDGTISVESVQNQGTQVVVELPALDVAAAAVAPPAPTDFRGHGTVLLVDDETFVLSIGTRILEGFGFRVVQAADAEQALALFRREQQQIQLAILDLTMPGTNGIELMHALRRLEPRLPVLLSSGYHESELGGVVDEAKGIGFLQKPYTQQALVARIQRLFGAVKV
ncbi:MAG: CHASE domain-containing protein, partial [Planctomycetes bacterium]|nr:CHASE domain-containing protein [Planctomycetota bacterium]